MSSTSSLIYSGSSFFHHGNDDEHRNRDAFEKAASLTLDLHSTLENDLSFTLKDDFDNLSPPVSTSSDKKKMLQTAPCLTVFEYIDLLYSQFEKRNPGFAERGCQDWLLYMQVDHHRMACSALISQWIFELGTIPSDVLTTKESSALFVKGIEYISTTVTAILLQIYRDAPGSFWKAFEKQLAFDVRSFFSFLYLFCFSCLFCALEVTLANRRFYFLFLQSLAEYLISDAVILRLEKDFFHLFENMLEQRQARLRSLISQSLFVSCDRKEGSLQFLNDYYTIAIKGMLPPNSSLHTSLHRIESWKPSPADLVALIESLSSRPSMGPKNKRRWQSWIRFISVPVVTAALVVFTRLLKNGLLGRRIML